MWIYQKSVVKNFRDYNTFSKVKFSWEKLHSYFFFLIKCEIIVHSGRKPHENQMFDRCLFSMSTLIFGDFSFIYSNSHKYSSNVVKFKYVAHIWYRMDHIENQGSVQVFYPGSYFCEIIVVFVNLVLIFVNCFYVCEKTSCNKF